MCYVVSLARSEIMRRRGSCVVLRWAEGERHEHDDEAHARIDRLWRQREEHNVFH